ncbi:MAG: hypothetical protein HW391_1916 [Chloroflexi bacterium]|nr:hypothetical protein [Chloroflexota bacterium]
MWPLDRLGLDREIPKLVEPPLVTHVITGPQRGDRLEHLGHPAAALAVRDPECLELRLIPAHANAQDGPTPRQDVQRRPLLGERHGVPERQDEDHRAQADRSGHAGERGEQRNGLQPRNAIGRRRDEEMVDEHGGLEPEVLGAAEICAHLGE